MTAIWLAFQTVTAAIIWLMTRRYLFRDVEVVRAWRSGHTARGRCTGVMEIEVAEESGTRIDRTHTAEFTTADGRQIVFHEQGVPKAVREGDDVVVRYRTERPELATAIPLWHRRTVVETVALLFLAAFVTIPVPVAAVACAVSGSACVR